MNDFKVLIMQPSIEIRFIFMCIRTFWIAKSELMTATGNFSVIFSVVPGSFKTLEMLVSSTHPSSSSEHSSPSAFALPL
jgi:hypothetical protein